MITFKISLLIAADGPGRLSRLRSSFLNGEVNDMLSFVRVAVPQRPVTDGSLGRFGFGPAYHEL